jgi:2-dehydro-3-deoxyphosphogluconate aldolase / (4S)-4-hydroxy-2-oxoglutarate aldolase
VQIERITDGTSTILLTEETAGKPDLWIKGVKTTISCATPSPPGLQNHKYRQLLGLLEQRGSLDQQQQFRGRTSPRTNMSEWPLPKARHKRKRAEWMSGSESLRRVLDTGIVAILRAPSSEQLTNVARALFDGGIDIIEVTLTVPGALEIVAAVKKELGSRVLMGAGTILDPETARAALLAGAEFIVSPAFNPDVIRLCKRYDKLVMPGAFTPTEILAAWESGADIVKVFPSDAVGPSYLKALKGPYPQIRLMPTGGVNLQTLPAFVKAGACAVGVGSSLVDPQAIREGKFDRLSQLAGEYLQALKAARAAG